MVETSRIWTASAVGLAGLALFSCATPPPVAEKPAPPPAPVAVAPPAPPAPVIPPVDALAEEARAMLAQAETDIQRARARKALWQRAWEDLLAARQAVAVKQNAEAIRLARSASDYARLGLEQLAYPAVK
jgi:hypothetical protein